MAMPQVCAKAKDGARGMDHSTPRSRRRRKGRYSTCHSRAECRLLASEDPGVAFRDHDRLMLQRSSRRIAGRNSRELKRCFYWPVGWCGKLDGEH